MKNLIYLIALVSMVHGTELNQEEIMAQKDGLIRWSNYADEAKKLPADAIMEKLGEGLRKTANLSIYSIEGTKEVAEKLKNVALSIPGHATYYQDKIESMRAAVLFSEKLSSQERNEHQEEVSRGIKEPLTTEFEYERNTAYALETLKFLPSAETVAVLGHFLNDPEGRDGKSLTGHKRGSYDVMPSPTNAEMAVEAIENLGIEYSPVRGKYPQYTPGYYSPEAVDAWKDWWNEVAAGKRTYRFIGSDVEYGPDGPVSKEVLERIKRDQKRDEERAGGRNRSSTTGGSLIKEAPKLWSIGVLIASCLLCAGAVWYFLRGRKVA